jgi:hypothetical protein
LSPIFRLDEYRRALTEFFGEAANAVARANSPLLAQIGVEQVEVLPPSQNTLPSGTVVQSSAMAASSTVTFSVTEGVAGRFDEIHTAVAQAASDLESSIIPQMLDHISQLCEASGNVLAAGDRFWDATLEMLETIDISFDEDGNPSLPSIAMHPDTAEKVGNPPDGYEARFNEVLHRRRDEWLAGRRTRRLPRSSN